jgi:anti-sigma regulatory factor (Ser/Thr protein kinase)
MQQEFDPEPPSSLAARRFLQDALDRWGVDPGDVLLVASELVANAIIHARTVFSVAVDRTRTGVRVEVEDHDVHLPVRRERDVDAEFGRGLVIVDELSRAWGVDRLSGGKRVWCELAT